MPELACPQQCSFCDQQKISGKSKYPDLQEIKATIDKYLTSFTENDREVEIAFFGGTFTGLPLSKQQEYLSVAHEYLKKGEIHGIRLSTRPDYIDEENLHLLKKLGVTTIELGAQSLDDEVLRSCNRGHTVAQVETASEMINRFDFTLGLQMMIGLPGDTYQKSIATTHKIIDLGAKETRIYPCLVIKGTQLAEEFHRGLYEPLTMDEAVKLSAELTLLFETANVKVIRLGLHRSEDLQQGSMLAGPYHISFKELVMTEVWSRMLANELENIDSNNFQLFVAPKQLNFAVGYGMKNKKMLLERFPKVNISVDNSLINREYRIISR